MTWVVITTGTTTHATTHDSAHAPTQHRRTARRTATYGSSERLDARLDATGVGRLGTTPFLGIFFRARRKKNGKTDEEDEKKHNSRFLEAPFVRMLSMRSASLKIEICQSQTPFYSAPSIFALFRNLV